jgi:hypothetical protein
MRIQLHFSFGAAIFGMNCEPFLAKRVRIALAQLRKLDFLQRTGLVDLAER